jgi:dipeptide/tripeptide permease
MKLTSIAIVLGSALFAAVLASWFDKQLGFAVFFGVVASMTVGEVIAHRRRRKVALQLGKSETALTEAMKTMQTSLAVAQAMGDAEVIEQASRALAAASALRSDIQSMRANLA